MRPQAAGQRMCFIGVSTEQSSIMKLFPLWMKDLGHPEVSLEGVDFPLHDDPQNYRQAVEEIKRDPRCLGALVTTHKINLLNAARDLFDYLDPLAQLSKEVSCISKRNGQLRGHAKDPVTGGFSIDSLLGPGYFDRTGAHVLFLGAGGSTTALLLHFKNKPANDQPPRIVVVNRSPGRIEELRRLVDSVRMETEFEYHCHVDPQKNDALLGSLPAGSLVVNATGMGKDSPGSPITDAALFPLSGVAWELNYRGELQFLHQALAQREARKVTVEDGWLYFLHGWTQVIAEVLDINMDKKTFSRLATIAEMIRPVAPQSTELASWKG